MTIFKENFSKRYSIVFSGSRDSYDIYKWVATQRSLGTPDQCDDLSNLKKIAWRLLVR